MSLQAFLNMIGSRNILDFISRPKVAGYNAAYRNYRKFQALEAHELADMGISPHEQKSQTLQDFLTSQNHR